MSDSTTYIYPEQLCVGLYVQLDLGWMDHDFAFNKFKIKDEAQLQAVLKLGLKQVRFDRSRSDCDPLVSELDVIPTPEPTKPREPTAEDRAREVRAVKLGALRRQLGEVDRKFVEASQRVKALNAALRNAPEQVIQIAGVVVHELVDAVLGDSGAALHSINGKAADDSNVHALNVTVLSVMLGRQLGLNAEDCHTLGLGALLHDIGKMDVPTQVLHKLGPLTPAEQRIAQLHTEFGLRRARKLQLDDEVERIIYEHHEFCDGSGYPKGIHEASIGRLSRMVCITNYYENLCNTPNPKDAISPHEALVKMFRLDRAKFDEVALKAFIRCMSVYPPGSLVQLEDERYALVMGMHPTLPLKPTLIVYEPKIPKEAALIVNLEQEPTLAIARGVRVADLSPEAVAYLNPRQQVSYYVDSRRPGK